MPCIGLAAEPEDVRQLLLTGQYRQAAVMAQKAIEDYGSKEEWQLLLTEALMAQGKYPEALKAITNALSHNSWSIRLRWQARGIFLANGEEEKAADMLEAVINTVSAQPRAYREPLDMLVFGQAALFKGADPKRVLDTVYEGARKALPKLRDVYLVAGELALEKHDYALAAKKFEEGLKQLPDDPDLHFGVARSYAPSDPELTRRALESTLSRNSNHVGALLLLTDHYTDAEDYTRADEWLDRALGVNPASPEAWAYRAVIAHFRNQPEKEKQARLAGLKYWKTNPRVDHIIGRKLSQHYRFAEGAGFQRQALKLSPDYLPAKAQLAQDLLRLGEESEGWQLAQAVQKEDPYDVEAYNLSTLHDTLRHFTTLTNAHFLVRMSAHEAQLYGSRVLELLEDAREKLCLKYGIELARPTLVEIFPEQKDFAVRTFGMPGNPGYLGVCFGSVITANSPASQTATAVNWEAVLWHEFAHVVTLQLTRNKMPRWLSEGISVYEELQANPAWGQKMEPRYRELILEGGLTPISKLSSAFLSPKSDLHLQFAYYQSCLVVEYLTRQFGSGSLKAILKDLSESTEINTAIVAHTAPMDQLETGFAAFAKEKALNLAPGLDWERPQNPGAADIAGTRPREGRPGRGQPGGLSPLLSADSWEDWARSRPTNFFVLRRKAAELVEEKKWEEAKPVLNTLIDLYPEFTGSDGPYLLLARAHRELGETRAEWDILNRFAELDDTAVEAYQRLMGLAVERKDWKTAELNARRFLAVNPLVPGPYRHLALAVENTGDLQTAIFARNALLALDPPDPAEAHFRLAELLHRAGRPGALRHVLQALEEAPRYKPALRLLLDINSGRKPEPPNSGEPSS